MKKSRKFARAPYFALFCLLTLASPLLAGEGDASPDWRGAGREIKEAAKAVGEASKETWQLAREKGREAWRETREATADAVRKTKRKIHEATAPKTPPEQGQPEVSPQEPGRAPEPAVKDPAPSTQDQAVEAPESRGQDPHSVEPPQPVPQQDAQPKKEGRLAI